MGQLFKSFKRYNYRLSSFLNGSRNCIYDSTMTGMKIAIIFFAIAMISATANAAPPGLEECRKKIEACNGDLECALRVAIECGSPVKGQARKMAPQDWEENASLQWGLRVRFTSHVLRVWHYSKQNLKEKVETRLTKTEINDFDQFIRSISNRTNKDLSRHRFYFHSFINQHYSLNDFLE